MQGYKPTGLSHCKYPLRVARGGDSDCSQEEWRWQYERKAGYDLLYPGEPLQLDRTVELNDHKANIVGISDASAPFVSWPVIHARYSQAIIIFSDSAGCRPAIVVHCSNIPLNTQITVSVKPANGTAVSATGLNTGTLTSSTATVSIVMPRGGGIIYATAATGN